MFIFGCMDFHKFSRIFSDDPIHTWFDSITLHKCKQYKLKPISINFFKKPSLAGLALHF